MTNSQRTKFIVGDIGGTNARLALLESLTPCLQTKPQQLFRFDYKTKDYSNFSTIVNEFLSTLISSAKISENEVTLGVFCVAGPVSSKNECKMTNLSWVISKKEVTENTPLQFVHLQNDFKSIGYGTLLLSPQEYIVLCDAPEVPKKVIAAIGAGTGLGQCFVTFDDNGDRFVHSSEGGHIDFFINNELDFMIYQHFKGYLMSENCSIPKPGEEISEIFTHVSIERILSGKGIEILYEFYETLYKNNIQTFKKFYVFNKENINRNINTENEISKLKLTGKQNVGITKYAFKNEDPVCKATVYKFIEIYGKQAANVAISLLPKGGLYIAGGVLLKILGNCGEDQKTHLLDYFRKSFFSKGRMDRVLKIIPVRVVLTEDIGMMGVSYVGKSYLNKMNKGELRL